jgi:hypothetical protein
MNILVLFLLMSNQMERKETAGLGVLVSYSFWVDQVCKKTAPVHDLNGSL